MPRAQDSTTTPTSTALGNLTSYDGTSYTYGGSQPHAATARGSDSYSYDANGNMTGRTVGGSSYTLSYDRGNRLIGVSGPSTSAIFLYDADGNRVLATVNGATTVYIAGLFEYTGGAATSYYGGAVMRRSSYGSGNGVFYVLADHLGSTSAIVDTSGSVQAQQYYYPYGANRGGAPSGLTDKRYTGQYHEGGLAGAEGLHYYNARWYDPALARFTQADTIVPEPGNPQSLNRFTYVYNNPVRYTDPTGHIKNTPAELRRARYLTGQLRGLGIRVNEDWGWTHDPTGRIEPYWQEGSWEVSELYATYAAANDLSQSLGGVDAFRERVGQVHIERVAISGEGRYLFRNWYAYTLFNSITLYDECFYANYIKSDKPNPKAIIVHELGHVWDNHRGEWGSELIERAVGREALPTENAEQNRWEHWADTVETAVYRGLPSEQSWGPCHQAYWNLAVTGWHGSIRKSAEN